MGVFNLPSPKRVLTLFRLMRRAFGGYKLQIATLTLLGFLGGILEGIGVNAFIPLLGFELGTGNQVTDTISGFIRGIFDVLHIPFVPKYLLLFIVVLFVVKAAVGALLDYVRIRINADFEQRTREKLFGAQLRSSWPHLLRQRIGHLETLILVDIPASKEMLARITVSIMYVTNVLMYLIVVFNASPVITLLTIAIGFLFVFVFRPIAYRIHALASVRARLQHEMTHHVSEHLSGMKTVKAFGAEEPAGQRGSRFFNDLKKYTISIDMLRVIAVAIVPPFAVIYVAIVFGLSFRFHVVAVAALPTIVYLIYRIFSYAQQLMDSLQLINGSLPYLSNVLAYKEQAQEREEVATGAAPFVFKKDIRFDGVQFAYEGGKDVLHDLSLTVPRGQMLGIIGPSGSGKTTTVDLMLRLLKPTKGSITLDGVDSRTISLADWRRKVAYVSQDFFLLHDTIRNNIRFYDTSISEEDIKEAAHLAHLDAFIAQRPEGFDALVGERGIELSAGQRQRLVIARALARKPEVLILDEATSALDAESEAHIQRMLQELKGKITIVIIAHRLSTIMHTDNLVVLEGGKVVETGSPEKLLGDKHSYFYKVSNIAS